MSFYPYPLYPGFQERAEVLLSTADILLDGMGKTGFEYQLQVIDRWNKGLLASSAKSPSLSEVFAFELDPFLVSHGRSAVDLRLVLYYYHQSGIVTKTTKLPFVVDKGIRSEKRPRVPVARLVKSSQSNLRGSLSKLRAGAFRQVTLLKVRSPVSKRVRPDPETDVSTEIGLEYQGGTITSGVYEDVTHSYRTWSGTTTPGFRSLHKSQLPINPHSVLLRKRKDGYAIRTWIDNRGPEFCTHSNHTYASRFGTAEWGSSPGPCDHLQGLDNAAIDKLIKRAGQDVNNVAESVAQLPLLIQMIGGNAKKLADVIYDLKRGNVNRAAERLFGSTQHRYRRGVEKLNPKASVANNWLELQYGWKPLLADIHGVAESLSKFVHADSSVKTIRSSVMRQVISQDGLTFNGVGAGIKLGLRRETTTTTTHFAISYRLSDPALAFLNQTGFTNPVSLAWELVPFSFVVDWFLPVGKFLENLTSFQGLTFIRGRRTDFTRQDTFHSVSYQGINPNDPEAGIETRKGAHVQNAIRLNRTSLTTFPSMIAPEFKNPFSVGHATNAVALLVQAFGGRR